MKRYNHSNARKAIRYARISPLLYPEVEGTCTKKAALGSALFEYFKGKSVWDLAGCLVNEPQELIEYIALCDGLGGKQASRMTSLLFNPHRLDIRCRGRKSVYESTQCEEWCLQAGRVLTSKFAFSIKTNLYGVFQLGVNGSQLANEFPPTIARDACRQYGLDAKSRVLDPCAGWGGRMLGCSVVVESYTAFEPSELTYAGLGRLEKFIQRFRPEFKANLYMSAYEDSNNLAMTEFDLAITSPPYFDTECYSNEASNSCNRYGSFDEWVKGFYEPLIHLTMKRLKPSGVFLLNIGDRVYPLTETLFRIGGAYNIKRIKSQFAQGGGLRKGSGESMFEIRKK